MIFSPYRTRLTQMIQNGESKPAINAEKNDKSSKSAASAHRKAFWQSKKGKTDG